MRLPLKIRELFVCLSIVVAWLMLFWPYLVGEYFIPYDNTDAFYPISVFIADGFRTGNWPWWNPFIFSGYPQISDPQGMMFSPLLVLEMMIPKSPSLWWFDCCVLSHVLMGAYGVRLVFRSFRFDDAPALLGTVVFMGGGVAASRLQHTPILLAYAYFPLVLQSLIRAIKCPSVGNGFLLALFTSIFVTHTVQITFLLCWFLICVALGMLWSRSRDGADYFRRLFHCFLSAFGGSICLLTVPLVSLYMLVSRSNRQSLPLAAVNGESFPLKTFWTLLNPNIFNSFAGNYTGPCDMTETLLYIGVVPLIFILAGVYIGVWRRVIERSELVGGGGALCVLSTLYAMGIHTPFYAFLYTHLPGIKCFRRPADAAYLLNIGLAFFGAYGLHQFGVLMRGKPSRKTLIYLLFSSVLTAFIVTWCAKPDALKIVLVVGCSMAFLLLLRPKLFDVVVVGIIYMAIFDIQQTNIGNRLNVGRDLQSTFLQSSAVRLLVDNKTEDYSKNWRFYRDSSVLSSWDNGPAIARVESLSGYNPLLYQKWLAIAGGSTNLFESRNSTQWNKHCLDLISRLSGVRYLISNRPLKDLGSEQFEALPMSKVLDGDPSVFLVKDSYPRLLAPTRTRVWRSDIGVVSEQIFRATDFAQDVWLEASTDAEEQSLIRLSERCTERADIIKATGRNSSVTIDLAPAETGRWVVVNDLLFPGWEATVDGVSIPLHRANLLFRAVCVPAGTRRLEMKFSPFSMLKASVNSLCGINLP